MITVGDKPFFNIMNHLFRSSRRCLHTSHAMSLRLAGLCPRNITSQSTVLAIRAQFLPWISSRSLQSYNFKPRTRPFKFIPTKLTPSRHSIQTQRFESFTPPSPESLGKAAPAKQYQRSIKWGRRLLYISVVGGTLYLVDTQLYASSITRSLRTFGLGVIVAVDYKLNFRPNPLLGGDIVD